MPRKGGNKKADAPEVVELPVAGGDVADALKQLQERFGALQMGGSGGVDLSSLPAIVVKRLNAVEGIQSEFDKLHSQHLAELVELEKKYMNLYNPLFAKRKDIITGVVDPAAEDSEAVPALVDAAAETAAAPQPTAGAAPPPPPGAAAAAPAAADAAAPAAADGKATAAAAPVGIPGFWLQAIKQHPDLADTVTETDEAILNSLQDISFQYYEKMDGFKLLFKFGPNDYFTDDVLVKEYGVDSMLRGEPSLLNIEASPINWKAGKNVTVKRVKKKSKRGKPVFKEVKVDSFFNFFSDPSADGLEAAGGEDGDDDDEENDVYGKIHQDFSQGLVFKDQLIPNAYKWFTGEGEDDDYAFGEDEGDDDDEDDDDEDEEDDDEEDEKPKKGGKGKGKKKDDDDDDDDEDDEAVDPEVAKNLTAAFGQAPAAGGAPAGDKPADCKTQ